MSWRWIGANLVYAIHDRQISEHGGRAGIRDQNAIESALARPRHVATYDKPDAAALAAAYAYGLARNHGFVDGNKRTAWVIARLFLADNGYRFSFDPHDAVKAMEDIAGGALNEIDLAAWMRDRIALGPLPKS
jgi:death-on-curing protein